MARPEAGSVGRKTATSGNSDPWDWWIVMAKAVSCAGMSAGGMLRSASKKTARRSPCSSGSTMPTSPLKTPRMSSLLRMMTARPG